MVKFEIKWACLYQVKVIQGRTGVMPDYTYITHVDRTFIKLLAEQTRQKKGEVRLGEDRGGWGVKVWIKSEQLNNITNIHLTCFVRVSILLLTLEVNLDFGSAYQY